MYEKLRETVDRALDDPRAILAGGAMIYKDGEDFKHVAIDEAQTPVGDEFIRIIIEKSFHWIARSKEAIQHQSYLCAVINDETRE
jgi:hypothetical protein